MFNCIDSHCTFIFISVIKLRRLIDFVRWESMLQLSIVVVAVMLMYGHVHCKLFVVGPLAARTFTRIEGRAVQRTRVEDGRWSSRTHSE